MYLEEKPSKKDYQWSKFFWNEWRNDGLLQSCSLVTKGFWMDILSLMFCSERRGYLQINNRPMTVLEISKLIHCDTRTVKRQIEILIEKKICSVDEMGVIFSRRMARENESKQQEYGKDTVRLQQSYGENTVSLHKKNEENRQKSQKPLYKNKSKNKSKNKESDHSPLTPHQSDHSSKPEMDVVVPLNETTKLFTQSVGILKERIRLSEIQCHQIIGRWFKQSNQNAELVSKAIMDGLHANNPVAYITAIIRGRLKNPPKPGSGSSKIVEYQWSSRGDGDEAFQKLSRSDQAIVGNFEKKPDQSDWYITHLKNHVPLAYRYLVQKGLIQNRAEVA